MITSGCIFWIPTSRLPLFKRLTCADFHHTLDIHRYSTIPVSCSWLATGGSSSHRERLSNQAVKLAWKQCALLEDHLQFAAVFKCLHHTQAGEIASQWGPNPCCASAKHQSSIEEFQLSPRAGSAVAACLTMNGRQPIPELSVLSLPAGHRWPGRLGIVLPTPHPPTVRRT